MRRIRLESYEGYADFNTWSVANAINNDAAIYNAAVAFMTTYQGNDPYRAFVRAHRALLGAKTPDGVAWTDPSLDLSDLNITMQDLES